MECARLSFDIVRIVRDSSVAWLPQNDTEVKMVGVVGFEPTASWSQTMRAKPLRHTPMRGIYQIGEERSRNVHRE